MRTQLRNIITLTDELWTENLSLPARLEDTLLSGHCKFTTKIYSDLKGENLQSWV